MNSKRPVVTLIGIVVLLGMCAVSWQIRNRPTLKILLNGKPAANVQVTDFQTQALRKTDRNGVLAFKMDEKQHGVLISARPGFVRLIRAPKRGLKTVDIRGRHIISQQRSYLLGLFPQETLSEQYDLSNAERKAVESGERTLEEVQASIRLEFREQNDDE